MSATLDAAAFRSILGLYPTGVCAITAQLGGRPVGMIVGSFTSVSLDPPLVGFFPDHRSRTWPEIRAAGRFCVNVLAADQHEVCRALSSRGADKFASIDWTPSDRGLPLFAEAVAWLECDLEAVHLAGDHDIAIGRVLTFTAGRDTAPMIFCRGGYGLAARAPVAHSTGEQ